DTEKAACDRRERAEQAFGIVIAIPLEEGEIFLVDVIGEVLAFLEVSSANARDGNESHESPVANEQSDTENDEGARFEIEKCERAEEVAERNPLKHTEKTKFFEAARNSAV